MDIKQKDLLSPFSADECHRRLSEVIVDTYTELPFWNWGPTKVIGKMEANHFEIWLKRLPRLTGRPLMVGGTLSCGPSGTLVHLEYENPINEYAINDFLLGREKTGGVMRFMTIWLVLYAASIEIINLIGIRLVASGLLSALISLIWFYIWEFYDRPLIRFLKRRLQATEYSG
jgi:hypothetical protein